MDKPSITIKLNIGDDIHLLTEIRAIVLKLQGNDKLDIVEKYPVFCSIKEKLEIGHRKS